MVFNFRENPQKLGGKKGVDPTPIKPGMFRLLAAARQREPANTSMRCWTRWLAFRVPIEGLHTETGPGVYEAAIQFFLGAGSSGPGPAVQDRSQGDRQPLRHHAELHGQMERAIIQAAAGTYTSTLSDGFEVIVFYDARGRNGMSKLFESYLAGQLAVALEFCARCSGPP